MKTKTPFPVTPESFSQCWDYVDHCRRRAKQQAVIAKSGSFLVTLFFLLSLIFLTGGLLYAHTDGMFHLFFETLFCFPWWQKLSGAILVENGDLVREILRGLVIMYLISAALFALLSILLRLIIHSRKKYYPSSGNYADNVRKLADNAQEARDLSIMTRIVPSVVASVLAVFTLFTFFFVYIFYVQDAESVTKLLSVFPFRDVSTNCLLYVLLLYLLFDKLSSLLMFITRPLYRYDFPQELLVQAQRAAHFAGFEEPPAQETFAALREEALKMERNNAYQLARDMLHHAAVCGDIPAMEHYARHCLLSHQNLSARYWLDKVHASGALSEQGKKMRRRMQLRLHHNVDYLKPEEAPPTKGQRILRSIAACMKIIWRVFLVALLIVSLVVCVTLFRACTDEALYEQLSGGLAQLVDQVRSMMGQQSGDGAEEIAIEIVSPFHTPSMTLTEAGTPWENACVAYDTAGAPVIFCYSKTPGGDLAVPWTLEEDFRKAGIYTGNVWDVRIITKNLSFLPATRTLVIAEDYLQSLEAGEYFLILNDKQYLPLLVEDSLTFNSTQRGLAAGGDSNGRLLNDLENPQDLTLSFYNLGDNTIRGVSKIWQLATSDSPMAEEIDPVYYSISPDGRAVTLKAAYLQEQQLGFCAGIRVRLANGDVLDTGDVTIVTVMGAETGLLELEGEDSYSLSKDHTYVMNYRFGLEGTLLTLRMGSDNHPDIIVEENLAGKESDYIDFENGTISIPEYMIKPYLTPGEAFRIAIGYTTAHGQGAELNYTVNATW